MSNPVAVLYCYVLAFLFNLSALTRQLRLVVKPEATRPHIAFLLVIVATFLLMGFTAGEIWVGK